MSSSSIFRFLFSVFVKFLTLKKLKTVRDILCVLRFRCKLCIFSSKMTEFKQFVIRKQNNNMIYSGNNSKHEHFQKCCFNFDNRVTQILMWVNCCWDDLTLVNPTSRRGLSTRRCSFRWQKQHRNVQHWNLLQKSIYETKEKIKIIGKMKSHGLNVLLRFHPPAVRFPSSISFHQNQHTRGDFAHHNVFSVSTWDSNPTCSVKTSQQRGDI